MPRRTIDSVASSLRGLALTALMLAFQVVPAAHAELVTHQFFGQVSSVSDGTNNTLDLTDFHAVGDPVTLSWTIERSTPVSPSIPDPYSAVYDEYPVTAYSYTLVSRDIRWEGGVVSRLWMTNDRPGPGARDRYQGTLEFLRPILGETAIIGVICSLEDFEGTAFASTSIPSALPAMGEFENRGILFWFWNRALYKDGKVWCTIDSGATPAPATSWGRVKGLYQGPWPRCRANQSRVRSHAAAAAAGRVTVAGVLAVLPSRTPRSAPRNPPRRSTDGSCASRGDWRAR